jgi:hypothetical protein
MGVSPECGKGEEPVTCALKIGYENGSLVTFGNRVTACISGFSATRFASRVVLRACFLSPTSQLDVAGNEPEGA